MGLVLVRHGETEWSRQGRHTSVTDLPLTAAGEDSARRLGSALARVVDPVRVVTWASPRTRALHTADLAGLAVNRVEPDLVEWNYGEVEGITTSEFRERHPQWPHWTVWDGPVTGGESAEEVGRRCDAVIERISGEVDLTADSAVLVAHAHVLRVLTARWLGLEASQGRLFRLDTATVSMLGHERTQPVILAWNAPAPDEAVSDA